MRDLRITFRVATSVGTPFQADTLFGHFCWAIAYTEGEESLKEFLASYENSAPFLISDGFPALFHEDKRTRFYLPYPEIPPEEGAGEDLEKELKIPVDQRAEEKLFNTALKSLNRQKWIEEKALSTMCQDLDPYKLTEAFLKLKFCPKSRGIRDEKECDCKSWRDCPSLVGEMTARSQCNIVTPVVKKSSTSHNVLNRWSSQSENVFIQQELFPDDHTGYYFLARIDEKIMTQERLARLMEYIAESGYGRDVSTGKGSLKDIQLHDFSWDVPNANAFLNLSSAYVPQKGELDKGFYSTHVKRGKLGSEYVLNHNPWKRPVLMLAAGSVLAGDPCKTYGGLVRKIHYELPEVVQYGYAFPLGVKTNV